MDLFPWNGVGGQNIEVLLEEADYLTRALHQHQQALELLGKLGRLAAQKGANLPARCRMQKAAVLERQGKKAEAAYHYSEALTMLSGTRDKATLAACLEGLARCQITLGQVEDVRAHLMRALDLSLEGNDAMAEERLRHQLGQLAERNHRLREARSWYRGALKLAREGENWAGVISDLAHLVDLATKLEQFREKELLEEERRQLLDKMGELAYVGPSATPRLQVVATARNLLYPEGLDIADTARDSASLTTAEDLYRQATALRKSDQHQESLPFYLSALARYEKLDQPGNISACLNGLGLSYKALAKEALRQELTALSEAKFLSWTSISLVTLSYQLLRGRGRDLAEKARACYLWALELHKAMDNLAGQASQISNLALVEEMLGNLDTARRYQRWAIQAHRKAGKPTDAVIDMTNLARLEEELGDLEVAAAWRRQAQEVTHAT